MSAIISPCGRYRYRLDRDLEQIGPSVAFVMVNPSTADATTDDATIRKCIGFAKKLSAGELIVVNLFAYRATDVRDLRSTADPVGPDNDANIREVLWTADEIIVAWGALNKLPEVLRSRWKEVVKIFDERHHDTGERRPVPLRCIGVCADGHPRHPLMVGYSSEIIDWPVPWFAGRQSAALRARAEQEKK